MAYTPPFVTFIITLVNELQSLNTELAAQGALITAQTTAIQSLETTVAAQAADLATLKDETEIVKGIAAYNAESFFGASTELTDIINPP